MRSWEYFRKIIQRYLPFDIFYKCLMNSLNAKGLHFHETLSCIEWEHTGSNRGPSACKADALNQLSYAPNIF